MPGARPVRVGRSRAQQLEPVIVLRRAGSLGHVSHEPRRAAEPVQDAPADLLAPHGAADEHPGASTRAAGAPGDALAAVPADEEKDWWDDPAMPWRHKPGRSDIACLAWMGVIGVVGLAMMPLRAWLLGAVGRIPVLVAVTGSRTGAATFGAVMSEGGYRSMIPWVLVLVAGTVTSCKFDWVYWWAGKLWGRGMIEVWAGRSERARRRYERVERWADKAGWLGMFLAYVPIPLPLMAVVFVLAGANRMSVRRFLAMDCTVCLIWLLGCTGIGYLVGAPITAVLDVYSRIANYVAIALVVVVFVVAFGSSWRKSREAARA
ncbi:SNARE associated Golgi protein [Propionibacterium ruminifibrarum]|uniref:SNARE associated Golgi protein n=1 Tax=Propionibacterium ruminifibrarum TaxID=1962131 RepID=A0A375I5L3_9ACTN|nr:SNARE associated Golgi protein [Propionibacterium ruminifibrarum]